MVISFVLKLENMTQELIEKLNQDIYTKKGDNEQGIFVQPFGIPVRYKEPVIYMRWETVGMTGGSYHEDSCLHFYTSDKKGEFIALDIVLKELKPNITYLQYKEIEQMILEGDNYSDNEDYYGNCTDYGTQFIVLSQLEKYLEIL